MKVNIRDRSGQWLENSILHLAEHRPPNGLSLKLISGGWVTALLSRQSIIWLNRVSSKAPITGPLKPGTLDREKSYITFRRKSRRAT